MANYYKILGVPETASEEEVRRAYTRLAVEYHPVMDQSNRGRFQEIQTAYKVLSDPTQKVVYDAEREEVDTSLFTTDHLIDIFRSRQNAEEVARREQHTMLYLSRATIGIAAIAGYCSIHAYRENNKSVGNTSLGVAIFLVAAGSLWTRYLVNKRREHEQERDKLTELIRKYSK